MESFFQRPCFVKTFCPDYPGAIVSPSPNFGPRIDFLEPDMIILHYTGIENVEVSRKVLSDPATEVSAHYLVYEDGTVVQMVRESDRAWHAGKSFWKGREDINSCSIGIEIDNRGYTDFPVVQMQSVIRLCRRIFERYSILPQNILAHSDVAPGRKIDPGTRFNWAMLAAHGIGHYYGPHLFCQVRRGLVIKECPTGLDISRVQSLLSDYGYGIDVSGICDHSTRAVLSSFQQHFRQENTLGMPDFSTVKILEELLRAL